MEINGDLVDLLSGDIPTAARPSQLILEKFRKFQRVLSSSLEFERLLQVVRVQSDQIQVAAAQR